MGSLASRRLSTPDVAAIVESKGLSYAVTDYLSSAEIEDGPLSEAWREAAVALRRITDLLEPEGF